MFLITLTMGDGTSSAVDEGALSRVPHLDPPSSGGVPAPFHVCTSLLLTYQWKKGRLLEKHELKICEIPKKMNEQRKKGSKRKFVSLLIRSPPRRQVAGINVVLATLGILFWTCHMELLLPRPAVSLALIMAPAPQAGSCFSLQDPIES